MTETIKEYANALFMLASEKGCAREFSDHLAIIDETVKENPQYLSFLESPAIPLSGTGKIMFPAAVTVSWHIPAAIWTVSPVN